MNTRRRIIQNRRKRVQRREQREHDASIDSAQLPSEAEKRATEVANWRAVWVEE